MDLIGIPYRFTVGKKATDGLIELKARGAMESEDLTVLQAVQRIQQLLDDVKKKTD